MFDPGTVFPVGRDGMTDHNALYEYGQGVRYYRLPGTLGPSGLYPGVTSVLQVWPSGHDALDTWKRGLIVDAWLRDPGQAETLAGQLGNSGARKALMAIPDAARDDAAAIGTAAHELILYDLYGFVGLAGGTKAWLEKHHPLVDHQIVEGKASQAMAALIKTGIEPAACEVVGWYADKETGIRYAGAVDLVGTASVGSPLAKAAGWGEGRPLVVAVDFKTGKGVYESAGLQLSAYANFQQFSYGSAWWELPGGVPRPDAAVVVHAGLTSWDMIPVDVGAGWPAFCAAYQLWRVRGTNPLVRGLVL